MPTRHWSKTVEAGLPRPGQNRDDALRRIHGLDCLETSANRCEPQSPNAPLDITSFEQSLLQKKLRDARISEEAFASALAEELRALICAKIEKFKPFIFAPGFEDQLAAVEREGGFALQAREYQENLRYVVTGAGFANRLSAAGSSARDLVEDLLSRKSADCPVAALLSDEDLYKLANIPLLP